MTHGGAISAAGCHAEQLPPSGCCLTDFFAVSMDPWMPRNEQKKDGLKKTSMVNKHK